MENNKIKFIIKLQEQIDRNKLSLLKVNEKEEKIYN